MELPDSDKTKFLAAHRALHSHPERVRDIQFQSERFLDARDLVQVRYEMLRRHLVEGQPITKVTQVFGISRQMFYMLLKMFRKKGLYGLLPRKPGPLGSHRSKSSVLVSAVSSGEKLPQGPISKRFMDVECKHGIRIYPHAPGRRLTCHKKKTGHN